MTQEVTEEEIENLIETCGPMYGGEIAEMIYQGRRTCPDCDRDTEEFGEFCDEVRDTLQSMVDGGKVFWTADWRYDVID